MYHRTPQRKSRSGGAVREQPPQAGPQSKSANMTAPIIAPTNLSSFASALPTSKISKEEQSRRNRVRAEVYALNAYLREIEVENFNAFMASRRKNGLSAMALNDSFSDCSDDSTVHPTYHQKDLLSRRNAVISDNKIPPIFKDKKGAVVKPRNKFGGV